MTSTLKYRSYPAARGRQAILLNRDIIRLFSDLRVSDSFLLQNNLREILFTQTGAVCSLSCLPTILQSE